MTRLPRGHGQGIPQPRLEITTGRHGTRVDVQQVDVQVPAFNSRGQAPYFFPTATVIVVPPSSKEVWGRCPGMASPWPG